MRRCPFTPVAWMIDAQPNTPSMDRQHALVFSGSGDIAYVDTGSHAWAWRLPGVLAGALTAALMYLLARMLFRRRTVAVLLAAVMALDALFFIQGRIAMNDSLLGFFIVYALTLLVALLEARPGRVGSWLIPLLGLPAVGVLLGLALSTKWVGAYAIGGAVLLVLARTQPGRWLAFGGMVLLTGVFGFQALAGDPPNFAFWILAVALTAVVGVIVVGLRARDWMSGSGFDLPAWIDPRRHYGLPFVFAMACLVVIPIGVYVASYIPWTYAVIGDPQLFPGWPVGHHGQTFLDLQSQMYHYHNDLRTPHAAGSPWWAWPFALKPVWGYFDTYSNGSQALMLITANPFLVWLGVPALGFGIWQAWRRRSTGLAVVLIAMLSLWLPWARIDRVAFNYHWYTILPFFYLLLAYFLAELWHGPSWRTWTLARVSFAVVLILPALMWVFKDPLCSLAGVGYVAPSSYECSRSIAEIALPIGLWLFAGLVAGWFVLGMSRPRRLVWAMLGLAAVAFVALYPAISGLPLPNGWPPIFQGLLPTWDISFQFNFNTSPVTTVPLIGIGPALLTVAVAAMAWWMMRAVGRRIPGDHDLVAVSRMSIDLEPTLIADDEPPDGAHAVEAPAALVEPEPREPEPVPPAPEPPVEAPPRWQLNGPQVDRWAPVGLFVLAALAYALVNAGRPATLHYFVPLADAFVHGQLGLSAAFSWLGEVVYGPNGLYNVVFPPAPAILLMPFVLVFGTDFPQQWASILLGAANVSVMALILGQMGLERRMRLVLALAFGLGTIVWYSAQVGTGWHFAHVTSLFFLLAAIYACQRDARTWVIGLLFAGAVLSRLTMLAAVPFFLAYLADRQWRAASDDRTPFGIVGRIAVLAAPQLVDLRRYLRLAWPMGTAVAVTLALYLAYNAARFGSPLENGYSLIPGLAADPAFADGLVSLSAIPGNLYALLLAPPSTAPAFPYLLPPLLGSMSLILTTPLLLWAVRARERDWFTIGSWASVGLILVVTLVRADPGGVQFGFRYAQDLLPFLFLLAVHGLRGGIGWLAWVAIGIGFAVNLWGMAYAFNGWWS